MAVSRRSAPGRRRAHEAWRLKRKDERLPSEALGARGGEESGRKRRRRQTYLGRRWLTRASVAQTGSCTSRRRRRRISLLGVADARAARRAPRSCAPPVPDRPFCPEGRKCAHEASRGWDPDVDRVGDHGRGRRTKCARRGERDTRWARADAAHRQADGGVNWNVQTGEAAGAARVAAIRMPGTPKRDAAHARGGALQDRVGVKTMHLRAAVHCCDYEGRARTGAR